MPIVKVELPSKETASRVRSESPTLKRSEFPDENQRECEGSGTQQSYSTSLATSQGLTLARCCIQTRGSSRGIKIVMDSHTILTMLMLVANMMFLYM